MRGRAWKKSNLMFNRIIASTTIVNSLCVRKNKKKPSKHKAQNGEKKRRRRKEKYNACASTKDEEKLHWHCCWSLKMRFFFVAWRMPQLIAFMLKNAAPAFWALKTVPPTEQREVYRRKREVHRKKKEKSTEKKKENSTNQKRSKTILTRQHNWICFN